MHTSILYDVLPELFTLYLYFYPVTVLFNNIIFKALIFILIELTYKMTPL